MATLTGNKISLTYDKVVQVPDQATGILQDGLGAQVYTNSDSIGTIKMFYPMAPAVLADYFDVVTGYAVAGTQWEGWHICDGQDSTPDLKGRFIVGYDSGDADYDTLEAGASSQKSTTLQIYNIPPHRHKSFFFSPEDGDPRPGGGSVLGGETWANGDRSDSGATIVGNVDWQAAGLKNTYGYTTNTGDGTVNVDGVNQLSDPISPIDKRPPFYTLLYVIKIS